MTSRRQGITIQGAAGDPGKDLFAYLFLLIMVFAFMLLMSVEQGKDVQKAPDRQTRSQVGGVAVSRDMIGDLVVRDSKLFLRFGQTFYDPLTQADQLENDGKVWQEGEGGDMKKVLYVKRPEQAGVTLGKYLDTFKAFAARNISVAFAGEFQ